MKDRADVLWCDHKGCNENEHNAAKQDAWRWYTFPYRGERMRLDFCPAHVAAASAVLGLLATRRLEVDRIKNADRA